MKTVCFKEDSRENEDKELEELIHQLHSLSVREKSYTSVYARCAHRFPNAVRDVPKPEYSAGYSTAAYSYQTTAPPPLTTQTWLPHATTSTQPSPLPPPSSAAINTAASFFRTNPRPDGCSFCALIGHRIRECKTAEEYVRSGRATVIGNRIHLPNGQPVPNDGTGRGIKASIDTWLASQSAPAPPPAQTRVLFT